MSSTICLAQIISQGGLGDPDIGDTVLPTPFLFSSSLAFYRYVHIGHNQQSHEFIVVICNKVKYVQRVKKKKKKRSL
jgi:hypothetical protein